MLRQRERARKALRNSHLTRAKIINLSSQSTLAALTNCRQCHTKLGASPHVTIDPTHCEARCPPIPSSFPSSIIRRSPVRQREATTMSQSVFPIHHPKHAQSPRDTRMIQQKRVPQSVALFLQVIPHCFQITRRSEIGEQRVVSERRVESGKRRGENVTVVASWERARRARAFLALFPYKPIAF